MFVKMKIKCFSKRKLNVRISKTKIKCATLGVSPNCCILGKSDQNPEKIWSNLAKNQQHSGKICNTLKKMITISKISAIFNEQN